jgi:drug/metabolite transporter (DMT)-like permease
MLLIVLLFAIFGGMSSIAKLILNHASPVFIVGSRMLLAGIILLSYHQFYYPQKYKLQAKQLTLLFLLAVFNIYLKNILVFFALENIPPFETCFIYNLSPFISALFSYFVFSEMLTKNQWLGLTVGFLGFMFLIADDFNVNDLSVFSYGYLAMLISVAASVYGWILMRQLVSDEGFSASFANGIAMVAGGVIALIHSLFTEQWDPVPVSDYAGFLQCSLFLIIFSNFICYNLYGYLLKQYTTTFISFAGFLTPLFSALFSWLLFGEMITWNFFMALCTVFIGLFLFSQHEIKDKIPARA